MRSPQNCHSRTISFHPAPAAQFVKLLDRVLAHPGVLGKAELGAVRDRLDDACATARWLRDYVKLELSWEDSLDLLNGLAMYAAQANPTGSDERLCAGVLRRLESAADHPGSLSEDGLGDGDGHALWMLAASDAEPGQSGGSR